MDRKEKMRLITHSLLICGVLWILSITLINNFCQQDLTPQNDLDNSYLKEDVRGYYISEMTTSQGWRGYDGKWYEKVTDRDYILYIIDYNNTLLIIHDPTTGKSIFEKKSNAYNYLRENYIWEEKYEDFDEIIDLYNRVIRVNQRSQYDEMLREMEDNKKTIELGHHISKL